MNRLLYALVLGLTSAVAAQATIVDTLVACKALRIKPSRIDPTSVKLRWTCPTPAGLALPGMTADPTTGPSIAGSLFLQETGTLNYLGNYSLPRSGWKRSGPPDNPRRFLFSGTVNDEHPPIHKCRVSISASGVSVNCRVFINALLPVSYPLAVTLITSGSSDHQRYCAEFGGTEVANDAKHLVRVNSPAPAVCAPL